MKKGQKLSPMRCVALWIGATTWLRERGGERAELLYSLWAALCSVLCSNFYLLVWEYVDMCFSPFRILLGIENDFILPVIAGTCWDRIL